jgi:hypothetical protein
MSSQRGNVSRTRKQKHTNTISFKNNKHGETPKTKALNGLQVFVSLFYITVTNNFKWRFKTRLIDLQCLFSLQECVGMEDKIQQI